MPSSLTIPVPSSTSLPPTEPSPESLVIWLHLEPGPLPRADDPIRASTNVHLAPSSFVACPHHWSDLNISQLQTTTQLVYADASTRVLDQNTLLAEILKHTRAQKVVYVRSEDEARELLEGKTREERKNAVVVLSCYDLAVLHPQRVNHAYDLLTHYCGTFVPSREEVLWDQAKVHDIQVLDAIAGRHGTWRPVSCLPGRRGECVLRKRAWNVLKRSNSSCGSHVLIVSPAMRVKAYRRGRPVCNGEVRRKLVDLFGSKNKGNGELHSQVGEEKYYQWIHQEYVEELRYHGEFRVFVATRTGMDGAREPYITHTIHTLACSPGTQPGHKWVAEPISSVHFASSKFSLNDLHAFVLQTYKALQAEHETGLESLRVGARLDIGWAPKKSGFFVNEITRWYTAESFPSTLKPGRQDAVMGAWADSFHECFPARSVAVKVENETEQHRRDVETEKEKAELTILDLVDVATKSKTKISRVRNRKTSLTKLVMTKLEKKRWDKELEELSDQKSGGPTISSKKSNKGMLTRGMKKASTVVKPKKVRFKRGPSDIECIP